ELSMRSAAEGGARSTLEKVRVEFFESEARFAQRGFFPPGKRVALPDFLEGAVDLVRRQDRLAVNDQGPVGVAQPGEKAYQFFPLGRVKGAADGFGSGGRVGSGRIGHRVQVSDKKYSKIAPTEATPPVRASAGFWAEREGPPARRRGAEKIHPARRPRQARRD